MRETVMRVCSRQDVLDACRRHDLGTVIKVLNAHGVTQGRIAGLTGLAQGHLSEYKTGKRRPKASSTFEDFADGLGMPPAAREALGLASDPPSAAHARGHLAHKPNQDVGLVYPDTPSEAAGNLAVLWRSDLGDVDVLRGQVDPGAWNDASLRWLVSSGPGRQAGSDPATGVRVGMADIDRFRATVAMFTQLDDRFGGGHARAPLVQYLSADAERLLHGRYTDAVGQALFSATAEATLLAAWMSYDSMPGLRHSGFLR
ncbi:MAG: helix-turn-helix domain-containing protein [Streptosporangiaceae bacterium]